MRRTGGLCLALAVCLLLLTACGLTKIAPINEGETYLEGSWYFEELHVGYNFFPDGGGYQFIGETVVPIRYGVFNHSIYLVDSGGVVDFTFEETDEGILIGGLLFLPVEENPEIAESVEAMLSEAEKQAAEESLPLFRQMILRFATLAAAVAILVILCRYFVKKKKGQY